MNDTTSAKTSSVEATLTFGLNGFINIKRNHNYVPASLFVIYAAPKHIRELTVIT